MTQYISTQLKKIRVHKYLNDRLPSNIFMGFIGAYIISYGYNIYQNGLVDTSVHSLVLMVLPILFTDAVKTLIESLAPYRHFTAQEDLSKVTVIIPCINGQDVLPITLTDLIKRFDRQHIIVSSNGSTDRTVAIAQEFGVKVLDLPPLGKVEAINRALHLVETPYVLTIDDDVLVGKAIMPTNLLDQGYEGVALRVLPLNTNWVTTLQTYEYRKSMDIGRAFHNPSSSVQSISGAIGLFHTQELIRQTEIHTGEFSGEDLQRTLIIHLNKHKKGVVIADSVVRTLVPQTLKQLFMQRIYGWGPGLLSNLGNYWKLLIGKNVPFRLRYEAFFTIFLVLALDPLRLLSLPVLLFSPTFFTVFYFTYLSIEFIPYIKLGARDPLWVVLVSPLYGLLTFVARAVAMAAFLYRRLTFFFGQGQKLDDYKFMPSHYRIISTAFTSASLGAVMWSYTYIIPIFSGDISSFQPDQASIEFISPQPQSFFQPESLSQNPNQHIQALPTEVTYTSQPDDSRWRVYSRLIDQYLRITNINLNASDRNQLIYQLLQTQPIYPIYPDQTHTLSVETINNLLISITSG